MRTLYSVRSGINKNSSGFSVEIIRDLFCKLYKRIRADGYFDEYLGWSCVDQGHIVGKVPDSELDVLLSTRKRHLWPIEERCQSYSEDDLFDIIEYLFLHVSKPVHGSFHSYSGCGMHWETFNKKEGEIYFRTEVNRLLDLYINKFELSERGKSLLRLPKGLSRFSKQTFPPPKKQFEAELMRQYNVSEGMGQRSMTGGKLYEIWLMFWSSFGRDLKTL